MEDSLFIHPMGQSENIYSPNFDNYLELWATGQYLQMKALNYRGSRKFMILPKS
jgi:acyl-homoserine lactone acylase PvdQ